MKLRNLKGPTIYDYPGGAERAVPVVAAPNYQKRVGPGAYSDEDVGMFQYPRVKAVGLGADDYGVAGPSKAYTYGDGKGVRIRLDENG